MKIEDGREFTGQILILASILLQLFIVDYFKQQQTNRFQYQMKESLFYIAHGIDQLDQNFLEDQKQIRHRRNEENNKIVRWTLDIVTDQKNVDPWEMPIFISTLFSAIVFVTGSLLVLFSKHFKRKLNEQR